MRTIKLTADYQCYPLWEASPGVVGNIDPVELTISDRLRQDLAQWAEWHDDTVTPDDWPFDQASNVAALTTRHVLKDGLPVFDGHALFRR